MTEFFDFLRGQIFGGKMTQEQVDGVNTLIAATEGLSLSDRAYLFATAAHETAFTMQPIHEYGPKSYFAKYEPGTSIGKNLGNTRPGDGYLFRGRGYVQLTGRTNYLNASKKLSVDLIADPELALRPDIAAKILVRGCTEGWFTGKKLSDYGDYPSMRRVVNGVDKAELIAGYAREFEAALKFLRDDKPPIPVHDAAPSQPPSGGFFASLLAMIAGLFKRTK